MPSATDVLACASFDDARQRYPAVINYALSRGPPEDVFRANWHPNAEFHNSLRGFVVAAAAAAPAPPTVDDVLACRDFGDAVARFPDVMQRALKSGPPESIFRENWAPTSEYHSSLRTFLSQGLQPVPAAAAPAPAVEEAKPTLSTRPPPAPARPAPYVSPYRARPGQEPPANRPLPPAKTSAARQMQSGVPTKELLLALARGETSVDKVKNEVVSACGGIVKTADFNPWVKPSDRADTEATAKLNPLKVEIPDKSVAGGRSIASIIRGMDGTEGRDRDGRENPHRDGGGRLPGRARDETEDDIAYEIRVFCEKWEIDAVAMDQLMGLAPEKARSVMNRKPDLSKCRSPNAVITKRIQDAEMGR